MEFVITNIFERQRDFARDTSNVPPLVTDLSKRDRT
jgi:hypothetical protein